MFTDTLLAVAQAWNWNASVTVFIFQQFISEQNDLHPSYLKKGIVCWLNNVIFITLELSIQVKSPEYFSSGEEIQIYKSRMVEGAAFTHPGIRAVAKWVRFRALFRTGGWKPTGNVSGEHTQTTWGSCSLWCVATMCTRSLFKKDLWRSACRGTLSFKIGYLCLFFQKAIFLWVRI